MCEELERVVRCQRWRRGERRERALERVCAERRERRRSKAVVPVLRGKEVGGIIHAGHGREKKKRMARAGATKAAKIGGVGSKGVWDGRRWELSGPELGEVDR